MNAWIGAILAFVAVASATVAMVLIVESVRVWRSRRRVQDRLDELLDVDKTTARRGGNLFLDEREGTPSVLEALVARVPQFANLPLLLENANVPWSANTFLLLTAGSALAGLLAGLVISGGLILAVPLAAVAGWIPYIVLRVRRARRIARFEETFPEAIDMLGRAIRAGHPLSAGIQMVGSEMAEPVGGEFRRMFEEQRFGVPFDDALMGMVDRVDMVDVRIFTTAVLVQREVGGNLAEILDNISTMIRSRFRIRRQLRTYTAQGRLSGIIVGSMPFVVGGAIWAMNPEYVSTLIEHPLGRLMAAAAIILQIIGYLWIRKIVNIEI